jgi:ubiquinone/menaquinone biosynthesis C-methylase UbiE
VKGHPVFARVWDSVVRLGGRSELEHRKELVSAARGRVLEVGAGTGLNLRLYPRGVSVVALEPEPTMAGRAHERARRAPVPVHVLRGSAEALPFPDASFETVVACLVFCTIPDPAMGASEVRRVLRPGGELRVYEHVRSPYPRGARWQDRVTPIWRWFGAGCHPNRDTVGLLRAAGFVMDVRPVSFGPPVPVRPHVLGTARPR